MAVPEKTHSGQLNRTKVAAQPSAGATRPAGKTNNCDSAITDAKVYTPEVVKEVDMNANKDAAYEAMKKQQGSNLPANVWKNRK
jgi:hypothetical protein